MTDNLALWSAVERTDPAHTKEITGKPYKGNSPKPHWLVRRATETFGPCGIGWGFEIVDEKLLDGALIEPGFYERIHMARVRVWYEWDGKRGAVEHVGQTPFSGRRRARGNGPGEPYTDEDAPKKSVTDALVKALSMIGFAGDIFLGRYDDSKYVAEVRRELREEAAAEDHAPEPDNIFPNAAARQSKADYIRHVHAIIEAAQTEQQLRAWWNGEKENRRKHGLTQPEIDGLLERLKTKCDELDPFKPRNAA